MEAATGNLSNAVPLEIIGMLSDAFCAFSICHIAGDGNCLFRAIAFFIYGTVDAHDRTRLEIVDEVLQNWVQYAEAVRHIDAGPVEYRQRLLGRQDYGDYVEIIAAEKLYNRPIFVWDQANANLSYTPSHGFFENDRNPDALAAEGFPIGAVLLAHNEAGQHYSIVLHPDHKAALTVQPVWNIPGLHPPPPLDPPYVRAPESLLSTPVQRPKNARRIACRKRAHQRQQQASASSEEEPTDDMAQEEAADATLVPPVNNDQPLEVNESNLVDSPAPVDSEEEQHENAPRRSRKRNRLNAKKKRSRKAKRKQKKPKRLAGSSYRGESAMEVDPDDAPETGSSEDGSDTSSESDSSLDDDEQNLQTSHTYVGKGFLSYSKAMGKDRDSVQAYTLEPICLKDDGAIMCPHCACRKWKGETTNCCDKGEKLWHDYEPPPPHIFEIFQQRHFYEEQRRYNALFAMTAFGAYAGPQHDQRTWVNYPLSGGKSMLTLHGRAYHRIFDPLASYEDENVAVRNLARLYLSDYGGHVAEAHNDDKLDTNFVHEIRRALLQHNTWAHTYLAVVDQIHSAYGDDVGDARIVFAPTSRAQDGPIVGDAPSTQVREIAAVMFKENEHSTRAAYVYPTATNASDGSPLRPRFMSILESAYETLQYPLLFFRGQAGWGKEVGTTKEASDSEKQPSLYFYARQQILKNPVFPLLPIVMQEWVCDTISRAEDMNITYLQRPEMQKRMSTFNNAIRPGLKDSTAVGKRLPMSHPGNPARRKRAQVEGLAVVARRGKPHLFVTMTCDKKWPEITQNLEEGQDAMDRPDLCNRVFKVKLIQLMKELRSGAVFGPLDYHMYVIEFQKRGLPHAHIILKLKGPGPEATHQVDDCIWAQLPHPGQYDGALLETVSRCMMHIPCEQVDDAPCLQEYSGEKKCKSHFPKQFTETTHVDPNTGRCNYRRPDNGQQAQSKYKNRRAVPVDNRHVVSYNAYLLLRFNCHINVDLVTADAVVKYLYKYVHKGEDFAKAKILCDGDEIEAYQTSRYITASEAIWRLLGYEMEYRAPAVQTLYTHLENEQIVVFEEAATAEERAAAVKAKHTDLMNYFARPTGKKFDNLTYVEYYERYIVTKPSKNGTKTGSADALKDSNGNTVKRRVRQNSSIARVSFLSPTNGDVYYLRLLLLHCPASGFQDFLCKDDGSMHENYEEAARALGLVQQGEEYKLALREASFFLLASQFRRLFVTLLLNGASGAELWKEFVGDLTEDYLSRMTLEAARAEALRVIDLMLLENGRCTAEYGLPTVAHASTELDRFQNMFDQSNENAAAELGRTTLTPEQLVIYQRVIQSVQENQGKIFMVRAPGGTGKTYTMNLVAAKLRGQGKIVIEVAASGIAALQMKAGWTSHSMFKLPREERHFEGCLCDITAESQRAALLRAADLIVWDEVTMSHRYSIEAVDKTLRDFMQTDLPFGGKTVAFAGDWRQTATIVPRGTDKQSIDASFISSPLYSQVEALTLEAAMRDRADPVYAAFVRSVGNGTAPIVETVDGKRCILLRLPDGRTIQTTTSPQELLRFVYGDDATSYDPYACASKALLAPTNVSTDTINAGVLKKVTTPSYVALSTDFLKADDTKKGLAEKTRRDFPPDVLHKMDEKNVPPHRLELKENALVMICRNVNIREKLVNGQKAVIQKIHNNTIEVRLLLPGPPVIVTLPRINFTVKTNQNGVSFQRRQYPLRLCYAMTINKAQGQTLDKIGLDLRDDVFAHGQLYVALSRARCAANVMVLLKEERIDANGVGLTANAVTPAFVDAAIAGSPEQATVAAARAAAAAASPPLQAVDQPRMPSGRAPAAVGVAPRSGTEGPRRDAQAATVERRSGRQRRPSQRQREAVSTMAKVERYSEFRVGRLRK